MSNKIGKAVIATSSVSGLMTAVSGVVTGLGFTSSGIAAGSAAAGMQAGIGNVVAGSVFATIQSLAASGIIVTVGLTGGIVLVGGGAVYGGWKLKNH